MALKYVRSRHAQDSQGSDFARALRQQQIMLALKNKLTDPRVLIKPGLARQLIGLGVSWLQANISQSDWLFLAKIGLRFNQNRIQTAVLGEPYLVNPKPVKIYDNQWVLVPRTGNWQEIQTYIDGLIK